MDWQDRRSSRLTLIMTVMASVIGCSRQADTPAEPAPPAAPPPVVVAPPPDLGRAEILEALELAASNFAEGTSYPSPLLALSGRPFRVGLPFGCAGPATEGDTVGYTLGAEARTLKLFAKPENWPADLADGAPVEAVEGFWLTRPWLKTEGCPAPVPLEVGVGPSPQTAAVAQAFEADGSRLLRRGDRPYEITRRVADGAVPGAGGFRLVLEGRVADAKGRPVRCQSGRQDRRPVCVLLVEFDRVAFEDARGETLGEWGD